jgi:FixJ family two-component response regulator
LGAGRYSINSERDEGGAVDFLTKPSDEGALLASVEQALLQERTNRYQDMQ